MTKAEFVRIKKVAVQIYDRYISGCDVGILRKNKKYTEGKLYLLSKTNMYYILQ